MKMLPRLFVAALFLVFAYDVVAQVSVNAAFNRNTVEAGDTFTLRVMVSATNGEPGKVDFSPWRDLLPADNILAQSGWSRSGGRWVRNFTLVAFDDAELSLPPLKVFLHSGEAIASNPLNITVHSVEPPADVNEAEPIRDILREPEHWTDYWPWVIGGLAVLTFMWWIARRKSPQPVAVAAPPPPVPKVPPYQLALQQLTMLEQQQPWKKADGIEPYYARLSLIVREYLEGRFGIPALESTTREILPLLKSKGFPENLHGTLREILQESDMTKFARNQPPAHYHEQALNLARQLVMSSN